MARRRRNASRATVGATVLGVATIVAIAAAAYEWSQDRPVSPGPYPSGPQGTTPVPPPPPPPFPEAAAVEPDEGYESRWASKRGHAIRRCKQDPAVTTWPQLVRCSLAFAYPESGDWNDPATWEAWMSDAAALVHTDLQAAVAAMFPDTVPNGWQAQLWMRGAREASLCEASSPDLRATANCVAAAIYPQVEFPPGPGAPAWAQQFYLAVRRLVAGRT